MKPIFVTFTGLDQHSNIDRALALSDRYGCEFGILFSERQQGESTRYPSMATIDEMLDKFDRHPREVKLAAHVCGSYAREIMEGKFDAVSELPLKRFGRIQVNHVDPKLTVLEDFARHTNRQVIGQWRDADEFTQHSGLVQWLYDPSGGRGVTAERWPMNASGQMVGYSGGITPENVDEMVHMARSPLFWIDMETGVRTDNVLDFDKVESVLRTLSEEEQPA